MSDHTIVIIWVVKIYFVQFFCVFLPPLLNLPLLGPHYFCPLLSPSLHEMSPWLSLVFLKRSRLSHCTVSLYFFALITEEGFLIPLSYSLELCIQMSIFFLFFLPLASLLFSAIYKASSDNHFAFLFLKDGLDHCLLYNVTNL